MPKDGFYEESATNARANGEAKLYLFFKIMAIVFFVVAVLVLSFAFTYVPYVLEGTVSESGEVATAARVIYLVEYFGFIVLSAGAGLAMWFLKNRFNISYDYTFVEDELRITKVFNGKRRKFLTTIKGDRVLQIGWVEDADAYESALRGVPHRKAIFATPNKQPMEEKEFIYILQSTSIEKQLYVIECRRQLLENLVYTVGRNKLVKKS